MDAKQLGRILKYHRIRRKLSQKQFCKLVNKSKTAYGEIERGKTDLSVEEWNTLFKQVGIKPLEHGLVITPVVKDRERLSKWWRWPLGYIIWETNFLVILGDEPGHPWDFLVMAFIISCVPIALLWWYWPPPWPFTKDHREKIRNWRIWGMIARFRAKVKEKYNEWLP